MNMAMDSCGYGIEVVSQYYAKYRPTYPLELHEKILQYLDEGSEENGRRGLAVDVGCGCGQSTLPLARHFETVIGIDSSESQLIEAEKANVDYRNVSYKQVSAEDLSSAVATESADLVTAGTAVHWFETEKFYKEAMRILKGGGTLAVYTSVPPHWKNQEADDLFHSRHPEEILAGRSQPILQRLYRALEPSTKFFDQCIRDDSMSLSFNYNLREAIGLIKSTPQYTYYKTEHPEHPDELDLMLERLMDVVGSKSMEEKVLEGSSPIYLLLGRKL